MSTEWQQWCRLCGGFDVNAITPYNIEPESLGLLNFTIQKHFALVFEEAHEKVCVECYEFVGKLQYFAERCDKANALFNRIVRSSFNQQNDDNYLQSLRYEAGLDEEKKFMVVETDLQGIDNFLLIEEHTNYPQGNNNKKQTVETRTSTRTKPKVEPCSLGIDEDELNNIEDDGDPTFDMDAEAKNDTSDDQEEDELSSLSEMSGSERKPVKKKSKKIKNNKKYGIKRIPKETELRCRLCNIDFNVKRSFDVHMRESHAKDEKPFLCPQCPKRYPSLYKLSLHETIHLPEEVRNIYPCELCDKRFRKLDYVQAHVRTVHSGERAFICEECGKSYATRCGLTEHLMDHNNDYPIQCPHCPKRFKFMARLRIHEEIHKTETHTCQICGLQLNTKITLRRHMDVHSDQKKFKCTYCDREFKRAKTLKIHLIQHSGLRPYSCPWCDKTFVNGANCRKHKKQVHLTELLALEASGVQQPAVKMPKLRELMNNVKC